MVKSQRVRRELSNSIKKSVHSVVRKPFSNVVIWFRAVNQGIKSRPGQRRQSHDYSKIATTDDSYVAALHGVLLLFPAQGSIRAECSCLGGSNRVFAPPQFY